MIGAFLEVAVILALVIANGFLAGAEIAVVSARKARLQHRARQGDGRARKALKLANSPNRFLSTVQIGITTVAVGAGALGGARVAATLAPALAAAGVPVRLAHELAIVVVVVGITLLTLVIGELVPKRIALHDPEGIASRTAGPMLHLSRLATPLVRLLSFVTDAVLRLVPLKERDEAEITEEEIRAMIAHATEAGVLEATEQQIVERLFRLSDTTVDMIMTPRDEIAWLDRNDPASWQDRLADVRHTRYLVADGTLDRPVGYVVARQLLQRAARGEPVRVEDLVREHHTLPVWTPVFRLLELFQWSGDHIAVISDADGRVLGLVTLTDVLAGLVGDMPQVRMTVAPGVVEREDGSWLVDGLLSFAEFAEYCGVTDEAAQRYPTLHAFMVDRLGGAADRAAVVHWTGLRLEVVDMDGTRVDQVLVTTSEGGRPG